MSSIREERISAVLALLYAKFPKTFFAKPKRRQQLKVGILRDLEEVLGDEVHPHSLRLALKHYTSNIAYLKRQRSGAKRIDLSGNVAGIVTKDEAERAKSVIVRIHANRARKNKAREEHHDKKRKSEMLQTSLEKLRQAALKRKAAA